MSRHFLAAFSAVLILLALAGRAEGQHVDSEPPYIEVTGQATVYVTPDVAIVTVGVVEQHEQVENVLAAANEKVDAVLAALRKLDLPENHIGTSRFNVVQRTDTVLPAKMNLQNAQQGQQMAEPQEKTYFEATRTFTVRCQPDQAGEVIAAAFGAGANRLDGVTFGLSDPDKAAEDARRDALENAEQKAKDMTRVLGQKIGDVLQIEEKDRGYSSSRGYAESAMGLMAETNIDVPAGAVAVEAEVRVRFSLRD